MTPVGAGYGNDFAKTLLRVAATCWRCGTVLEFEEAAALALHWDIHDNVVMCKGVGCRAVYDVVVVPGRFQLVKDVTDTVLRTREFFGKTEDDAMAALNASGIPKESISSIVVSSVSKTEAVVEDGSDAASAIATARAQVPSRAYDVGTPDVCAVIRRSEMQVLGKSEAAARRRISHGLEIEGVACVTPPIGGFLGIGGTAGVYRVACVRKCFSASIAFRLPVTVSVKFTKYMGGPY